MKKKLQGLIFLFIFITNINASSNLSSWNKNGKSVVVIQCGILITGSTRFLEKSTKEENDIIGCCTKNILNNYNQNEYIDIKKDVFLINVESVINNAIKGCKKK
ncbi:MAG: hypothetical protein WBF48_08260 [Halarcobacter sp.]